MQRPLGSRFCPGLSRSNTRRATSGTGGWVPPPRGPPRRGTAGRVVRPSITSRAGGHTALAIIPFVGVTGIRVEGWRRSMTDDVD